MTIEENFHTISSDSINLGLFIPPWHTRWCHFAMNSLTHEQRPKIAMPNTPPSFVAIDAQYASSVLETKELDPDVLFVKRVGPETIDLFHKIAHAISKSHPLRARELLERMRKLFDQSEWNGYVEYPSSSEILITWVPINASVEAPSIKKGKSEM